MAGIEELAPIGAAALAAGWFANALVQWFRSRTDKYTAGLSSETDLEKHRDALTFELLQAARIELADLREEVQRLRPMEMHLLHFDEALSLLGALLLADTETESRDAKRAAQAFLNRIKRLREARDTLRNEVQRLDSTITAADRSRREEDGGKT